MSKKLKDIILPDLGEGIDGAEVSEISVSVGDTVKAGDTIVVLESDKASMEIPSDFDGVVKEVSIASGDEVNIGQLLIKIESDDSTKEEPKAKSDSVEKKEDAVEQKTESFQKTSKPASVKTPTESGPDAVYSSKPTFTVPKKSNREPARRLASIKSSTSSAKARRLFISSGTLSSDSSLISNSSSSNNSSNDSYLSVMCASNQVADFFNFVKFTPLIANPPKD